MNKKVFVGLAATTALGAVMVGGTAAHAEGNTSKNTDSSIKFLKDNDDNTGPFAGELSFAYVPAKFDFGSHTVESSLKTATYSQVIGKDSHQYVAVSDDRADKKNGWTVKATLDEFENTVKDKDGNEIVTTLDNAKLSLNLGVAQKYNIDVALSDTNKTPTPGITAAGSLTPMSDIELGYYSASPTAAVSMVAGEDKEVTMLDYGKQAQTVEGTLAVAKEVTGVKLQVMDHEKVQDKTFTSKVNWVLAEDPAV